MRGDFEREFGSVYERLAAWCRARGYAGHDPFDALNSPVFQSTPLRRSRLARIAWTQLFKRSPVNLRSVARVPAERNAKGTALFALAALARFRTTRREEDGREARALLEDLVAARIETAHGAAWGYNFDWQGRAFFAPRGTPTAVPTAFAVRALVEASETFAPRPAASLTPDATPAPEQNEADTARAHLLAARAACDFILKGLNRSVETADELCFSYTPLDRTRVFNASLLAAEALASVGALTGERELKTAALRAARYVVRRQRADGSWPYGADSYQSWADNFHTAFVLTSLARILRCCGEEFESDAAEGLRGALGRGYGFWRASFFVADGWPKYYHDRKFPADAHSAGASVVALVELREFDAGALDFAGRVARWAVRELFDRRGFFRYQRRRLYTVRTPYMRWSQAWMAYALARLLEGMRAEG
jgi:hypothetical protein